MKRLSAKQVETYRRDGFMVVGDLMAPALIDTLRATTEDFVARSLSVSASDSVFDFGRGPSGLELRRIKSPERQAREFVEALVAKEVLDCVEDIIGPSIRFWGGKLNLKHPNGETAVEWHQDWAFGPATNDDLLTVGISLDDASTLNGCLLVLPGSHRGPLFDHWLAGRFVGAVTEQLELSAAVPLEVPAGGISIHHIRALHGSAPNRSSAQRRLLLYSYAAADAWPLAGIVDIASFDSQILRGVAPDAPRLERVPVRRWPRWEQEDLGSDTTIFDLQSRLERSAFQ